IAATATASLRFADSGPIDGGHDPFLMGRGLISHGAVSIYGQEVTAYGALATAPRAGDKVLHMATAPVHWKKGDRLVLPAVHVGEADEDLTVLEVKDRDVAVAPLAHDHLPPAERLTVYVANLTRNVVIESQ